MPFLYFLYPEIKRQWLGAVRICEIFAMKKPCGNRSVPQGFCAYYFRMDSISRLKSFRAQTTGTGYRGLASFFAQVIIWSMSLS